jgi:NAD(P)-dependent dehydrogenase (short-subunit alcohol dehydrogenase family)
VQTEVKRGEMNNKREENGEKAGVIGFTMALDKEVGTFGININSASPGPTITPLTAGLITGDGIEREVMLNATYLGRLGKPKDIAYTAAFLASDEASFITAQNLPVCDARNFSGGPDNLYIWQPLSLSQLS